MIIIKYLDLDLESERDLERRGDLDLDLLLDLDCDLVAPSSIKRIFLPLISVLSILSIARLISS